MNSLKMPPLHPGEVLLEEFIKPKYGSVKDFVSAHFAGISTTQYIYDFTTGDTKRRIDEYWATVLSNILGTTREFWFGLQDDYDREVKEMK
jgi:plasmid maintenance system antidote protein VapI